MSILDVLRFLSPGAELVQGLIGALMLLMFASTSYGVWRNARPHTWQDNWQRRAASGGDAAEAAPVSLAEMSDVVASRAEKAIEVMPGVLLILGLLGTFLGLGIALNDASAMLSKPQPDSAAMAGTMQGLTHMMEGLGTKFRTSAWGILFFLLLKVISTFTRHEERRLNWCSAKLNEILQRARQASGERDSRMQDSMIQAMESIGKQFATAIGAQTAELQVPLQAVAKATAGTVTAIAEIRDSAVAQLASAKEMQLAVKKTQEAMEHFVQANDANIQAMSEAGKKMAAGAVKVAASAEALCKGVDTFEKGIGEVVVGLKRDLSQNIGDMNDSFQENLRSMAEELKSTTANISSAVDALKGSVSLTMGKIEQTMAKATAQQNGAIGEFTEISTTLQKVVMTMQGTIDKVATNIQMGLKAVSESGLRMSSMEKRFDGLIEQCNGMIAISEKAVNSGADQAKDLRAAANSISTAAGKLFNADKDKDSRLFAALDQMLALRVKGDADSRKQMDQILTHLARIQQRAQATPAAENAEIQ
ncbi:hypothetical protein CF70_034395 [Cupriavidus sp. SK-3]|uniref:hypothetical protein n=1 Tax=Cupriavidus sp. SK-3 TaxID=1470558 RepID=UPI00044CBF32|nr:hypothetical protein [Cupriavidus sp. SK-3]KDP87805.1 hypothetical protein CF70_034395 [Cupriavidus sp. SK-3]